MNSNPNLIFAWLWILLGFVSGLGLGLFFHRENWLGGYGSFPRRMYRLAHISCFGLGAVNLLFWLTLQRVVPSESFATVTAVASWAFIIGGVTMPLCCLVMAHFPKAHLIFAVPVVSLILGGALTLVLIHNSGTGVSPVSFWSGTNHGFETHRRDACATSGASATRTLNPHPSTLNLP
jgi:hypothetical protein